MTESAVDLENHRPRFNWRTDSDGEEWIYDGEMPVGELFAGFAGTQPMEGIARPISLHNLRLIPGGPLFIAKGEGCGPMTCTSSSRGRSRTSSWRQASLWRCTSASTPSQRKLVGKCSTDPSGIPS